MRFPTVRDLFDAFPTALDDIGVEASDETSLAFLARMLSEQALVRGLSFCAYLLPRREAVWWGCQCLRQLNTISPQEAACLGVAEAWVRDPEEARRKEAVELANKMSTRLAATWAAFAAAWAGGTVDGAGGYSIPVPAHSTAQAIRAALILGAHGLPEASRMIIQARWLEGGMKLAAGSGETSIR
jgi:hypothetical protein